MMFDMIEKNKIILQSKIENNMTWRIFYLYVKLKFPILNNISKPWKWNHQRFSAICHPISLLNGNNTTFLEKINHKKIYITQMLKEIDL